MSPPASPPGYELAGLPLRRLQVVPDQEKRSSIHEVDGYAHLGEDTTLRQARFEALTIAKRQALEMARVRIESNSLIKDGKLEYDLIKSGSEGYVAVLKQKDHGLEGNRYHVWIRAEVKYDLKPSEEEEEAAPTLDPGAPLTVRVWTHQKQYRKGQKVVVNIAGNRDFYARIVNVDSKGDITQLLPENLWLKLNPKNQLNRSSRGMPFLGYRLYPKGIRLATSSRKRFVRKFRKYETVFLNGEWSEETLSRHMTPLVEFTRGAESAGLRANAISRFGRVDGQTSGFSPKARTA